MQFKLFFTCLLLTVLIGCEKTVVNSPYPAIDKQQKILYSSFLLRPKHLDPARSYSSNEVIITGQIYEPPYQYHYLKRPYELEPLTAQALPEVTYLDANFNEVAKNDDEVVYTRYEIRIRQGVFYQPHPAFAKDEQRNWRYHNLEPQQLDDIETLSDFKHTATRELKAADFIFQIKRLAHPQLHSPISGLMSEHIVGLAEFAKTLREQHQQGQQLNLRKQQISGVKELDDYCYQILVYGKYPQLRYWLAMPFFAPIPWEADAFYNQPGFADKNITLDWFPVGTGPFYMTENNPNQRIVLTKNPNYHDAFYPAQGEENDRQNSLLEAAGQRLPFLDKIVFSLEKENTSYWGKFLQGYYDVSGISSDSFDQAVQMSATGEFGLSDKMEQKGIKLRTTVAPTVSYIAFNMLDPVVGGYSKQSRKLRRALSIALDEEEYISIFANGRGIAAQGPIPPGIFGHVEGDINHYVYHRQGDKLKRRDLNEAKQLLAEAGYPDGRNAKTGEPLVLYLDIPASGPDSKAYLDWLRKQFNKLNLQLVIRSTDYNRFQDKIRQGQAQLFRWGWNADYPDPENFLFLLYGSQGRVNYGGENASNYANAEFDRLFEQMRVLPNSEKRQQIIQKMLQIVRVDAPWIWGYHPKGFALYHAWNKNVKPNLMANNTLKYRDIDVALRNQKRVEWNQPVLWPLGLLIAVLSGIILPAVLLYRLKKYKKRPI